MKTPDSSPSNSGPNAAHLTLLATRLREAVSEVHAGRGTRVHVEAAVRDLTAALKDDKLPPERMLLRIKELLADAGLRPTYAAAMASDNVGDSEASLYRDVISWCIRDYYDQGATS